MDQVEYSHLPVRNIVLIGIGTVFGSLGVILAFLLAAALVPSVVVTGEVGGLLETVSIFLVYGSVGAGIAATICAVLIVPMLLLWFPVYSFIRESGYNPPYAAMACAGCLSVFCTIGCAVFVNFVGAAQLGLITLPFVVVPFGISVFLAKRLSYDRSGVVLG